jgi:hypothetical protein
MLAPNPSLQPAQDEFRDCMATTNQCLDYFTPQIEVCLNNGSKADN